MKLTKIYTGHQSMSLNNLAVAHTAVDMYEDI